ncbi:MAG: SagB/ThcOx family dehydrogenase [Pseudomonadota bacterium]
MKIDLPPPDTTNTKSLNSVIAKRRSYREFSEASIDLREISVLLWAAQGLTGSENKRTTPSAGAQYPSQIYVVVVNISDLSPGIFQYCSHEHSLDLKTKKDFRKEFFSAAIDHQPWGLEAAMILVLTADFELMKTHFFEQPPRGKRGDRYIYLEAGSIAQNVQLQASCIDLGAVLVGGFDDEKVQKLLGVNESIKPTALICIGKRK